MHAHEFSELVVVTGGHGLHVTGQEAWRLSLGDAFVIGGSRPHDYRDMENLQLINVLFDRKAMSFDLMDLAGLPGYHALFHLEPAWRKRHDFRSRLRLTPQNLDVATSLVNDLENELQQRGAGFGFLAIAHFMRLVGFLSRCYSDSRNADSKALLRIAEAISHLESNYCDPIQLDELVGISRMSKRSFLRAFEAAVGCTPIAYLIRLRVSRAAKMLSETNDQVTKIAYAVGFNDSNYFTRQFRKHYGVSPRAYRVSQV